MTTIQDCHKSTIDMDLLQREEYIWGTLFMLQRSQHPMWKITGSGELNLSLNFNKEARLRTLHTLMIIDEVICVSSHLNTIKGVFWRVQCMQEGPRVNKEVVGWSNSAQKPSKVTCEVTCSHLLPQMAPTPICGHIHPHMAQSGQVT